MAALWLALLVVIALAAVLVSRAMRRAQPRPIRRPGSRIPGRPAARSSGTTGSNLIVEPVDVEPIESHAKHLSGISSDFAAGASTPPAPVPKSMSRPVSPASLIELSGIGPAPEQLEHPWDQPPDPAVLSRILARASEILDRVATRRVVLEAISNPSPDPRALTDVVVSDPALSARVLRTVNSPVCALRHPMASVFRAVLYLGHQEVRSIVWRASFAEAAGDLPGTAGEMLDAMWRHSFAVSRVAYALGRALGVPQPDAIATAALLHDAGKLVVIAMEPEKAAMIYRPPRFGSAVQLHNEWEMVGVGHGVLGGEVVRAWGLPAEVAIGVQQHHLPSFLTPDHAKGNAGLIGIVHLADLLCHAFARVEAEEVLHRPVAGWLSDLGVTEDLSSLCDDHTVLRALRAGASGMMEGEERAA